MTRRLLVTLGALMACAAGASSLDAQPLGTFRWQLRPFCNVVTVAITQNGGVYRLEGIDDQCGNGADAASVTGTAFPNADGTIGLGLNIVTTPGGRPLHVDAEITLGAFNGTWRDSAGATGSFVLTPGGGSGGITRPLPSALPSTIALRPDGGFTAGGAIGVGSVPASGPGVRMMWYPGKAAFRAGQAVADTWDDANVGPSSAAFGSATRATGPASVALGSFTVASGSAATAMGSGTSAEAPNSLAIGSGARAIGSTSTAMGSSTVAEGPNSLAIGSSTLAVGSSSMALGSSSLAGGANALAGGASAVAGGSNALAFGLTARAMGGGSVALGTRALANGVGSFVFGDSNPGDVAAGTNEFKVRASGGVFLYSNATQNLGVALAPSGTQWLVLSDAHAKHRFRSVDDDELLDRIARLPVMEWSYKEQDAAIRHIGPTAQDFHATFGLGEDPLRIGTLDADGVALAGVKAVESRTRAMRDDHEALRMRVTALERALAEALAALHALRAPDR